MYLVINVAPIWKSSSVHPYGSGSMRSEYGAGNRGRMVRNRACAIQSWFRRSTEWTFFQIDEELKHRLFWTNKAKIKFGRKKGVSDTDKFSRMYGTVVPSSIPESPAWWSRQTKELAAITDARHSDGFVNLFCCDDT